MSDTSDLSFGSEAYERIVRKSSGLLYTKYVNRNLAWLLTRYLVRFTPNQVSITAFLLLAAGLCWFVIRGEHDWHAALLLYFCLSLNYVLDSADGQIARFRKCGSPRGEWLDHSLDALRMTVIHAVFIYFTYLTGATIVVLGLVFLNIVFQPALFASNLLREKLLTQAPADSILRKENSGFGLLQLAAQPADQGIFVLISLLIVLPEWFHVAYSAYGLYWAAIYFITMAITFAVNKPQED